jgi:hypothetical protein
MLNQAIAADRLRHARWAYTTRAVHAAALATSLAEPQVPRAGDLVLARVEAIGHHKSVELATGRKAQLYVGDEIVVCFGNRYAPDQFEAEVPGDLGLCHLAAAGGVAARVVSGHAKTREPTVILPIGLLSDSEGQVLNLRAFALPTAAVTRVVPVIAVVGTAMNAGKTTTAAAIVHAAVGCGWRVGGAKVTGTGAGNDVWMMRDAGADPVVDFTDMGVPTTYLCDPSDVIRVFLGTLDALGAAAIDIAVIEVADGIHQRETAMLLESDEFKRRIGGVVFAANDAMGAQGGVRWLSEHELPVLAVSGQLTQSPLAIREAAHATMLPVLATTGTADDEAHILSTLAGVLSDGMFDTPRPRAALACAER